MSWTNNGYISGGLDQQTSIITKKNSVNLLLTHKVLTVFIRIKARATQGLKYMTGSAAE